MGGVEVYNYNLCFQLSQCGIAVHHIVGTKDKKKKKIEHVEGFYLNRIYLPLHNPVLNYIYRLNKIREIIREVYKRERLDLICFHEGGLIEFAKRDKHLKNIPLVYFFHAPHFYELLYDFEKIKNSCGRLKYPIEFFKTYAYSTKFKILEERSLNFANKIIVMSEYSKKNIKLLYNNLEKHNIEKKIEVIPIGIDTNTYTPTLNKKSLKEKCGLNDRIVFFTLRRLTYRMGLENLILAFYEVTQLTDGNPMLLIGGEGILKKQLEDLVARLRLEDNVKILGFLSESEKINFLQMADAFILPSEELEGFGIVNLEALACNTPVIATNVGAIPEIVSRISPELLADTSKPESLRDKIIFFIENKEDYEDKVDLRLYSNYALEFYSWYNISMKIIKTFNSLL